MASGAFLGLSLTFLTSWPLPPIIAQRIIKLVQVNKSLLLLLPEHTTHRAAIGAQLDCESKPVSSKLQEVGAHLTQLHPRLRTRGSFLRR